MPSSRDHWIITCLLALGALTYVIAVHPFLAEPLGIAVAGAGVLVGLGARPR